MQTPRGLLLFRLCAFAVVVLTTFASQCVVAAEEIPFVIPEHFTAHMLGKDVSYYEDPTRELSFDQLQKIPAEKFFTIKTEQAHFGLTKSAIWTKVILKNTENREAHLLLHLDNAYLDARIFQPQDDGTWLPQVASSHENFDVRPIKHQVPMFELTVPPHAQKTFFVRTSAFVLVMPMTLWSYDLFFQKDADIQFLDGGFYGIMSIMVLYNLCLFFFVRSRAYLFYVAYVFSMELFWAGSNGLAFRYLWPNWPWWHVHSLNTISSICLASTIMFVLHLVEVKKFAPRLHKIMVAIGWLGYVSAVLVLLPFSLFAVYFSNFYGLLVGVFALGGATYCAVKGSRPARLYLLAFLGLISGLVSFILTNLGILEGSFWASHGIQLGAVLQVTLLSLILADSINVMRKKAFVSQKRLVTRLEQILASTKSMTVAVTEEDAARAATQALVSHVDAFKNADITLFKQQGYLVQKLSLVAAGHTPESIMYEDIVLEAATAAKKDLDVKTVSTSPLRVLAPVELKGASRACLEIKVPADHTIAEEDASFAGALASSLGITFQNIGYTKKAVEGARLDAELQAAQAVQRNLLPKIEAIPGVEVATSYISAEETGGDWFGYSFNEASKTLYLYIGDVTGHGIPAAIMTGVAFGAVYAGEDLTRRMAHVWSSDQERLLTEMAISVNRVIYERAQSNLVMTMSFVALSLETGEMILLNAGHCPTMLIRTAKSETQVLQVPGDILGTEKTPEFGILRAKLEPNDMLFFHTDGLVENTGPTGKILNKRQLIKILKEPKSASDLRDKVLEEGKKIWLDAMAKDDIATLTIQWQGPLTADKKAA